MTPRPWIAVPPALLGLLAAMVAAPVAQAAHEAARAPAATVSWAVDLPAALSAARAEQRLVLVCFNMDGEQANERALAMYRSAEFARATADVVCVLCSSDDHGDEGAPCSRFHFCTCAEHKTSELRARRHFFGAQRENVAPQHILLFPDGLVAWHALYEVAPAELYRAIAGAHRMRTQPLAQRLRGQRAFLEQMRGRAERGLPTAYMQIQSRLVQTPPQHFVGALQALGTRLVERVLRDLEGYPREQALPLLQECAGHPTKAVRELALAVAEKVAKRSEPAAAAPAADDAASALPQPLAASLAVLGPADDLGRVYWVEGEQALAACRDHITVLWFFLPDAADLQEQVAAMNDLAAAGADSGVRVLGLACCLRPADAVANLGGIGCKFPVGAYQATNGGKLFAIERFSSWIVLDPETNVVHRSPQDGQGIDRAAANELALRMAASPIYKSRLLGAGPGK